MKPPTSPPLPYRASPPKGGRLTLWDFLYAVMASKSLPFRGHRTRSEASGRLEGSVYPARRKA